MDNIGKFKPGTRFRGDVSGDEFEVVDENPVYVKIRHMKTGKVLVVAKRMLEKCLCTILDK